MRKLIRRVYVSLFLKNDGVKCLTLWLRIVVMNGFLCVVGPRLDPRLGSVGLLSRTEEGPDGHDRLRQRDQSSISGPVSPPREHGPCRGGGNSPTNFTDNSLFVKVRQRFLESGERSECIERSFSLFYTILFSQISRKLRVRPEFVSLLPSDLTVGGLSGPRRDCVKRANRDLPRTWSVETRVGEKGGDSN